MEVQSTPSWAFKVAEHLAFGNLFTPILPRGLSLHDQTVSVVGATNIVATTQMAHHGSEENLAMALVPYRPCWAVGHLALLASFRSEPPASQSQIEDQVVHQSPMDTEEIPAKKCLISILDVVSVSSDAAGLSSPPGDDAVSAWLDPATLSSAAATARPPRPRGSISLPKAMSRKKPSKPLNVQATRHCPRLSNPEGFQHEQLVNKTPPKKRKLLSAEQSSSTQPAFSLDAPPKPIDKTPAPVPLQVLQD
jgi:hypothetical protein